MDPADRWRRIEELFHAALELDLDARSAFLQQACGADADLRREVESLLQSAEKPMDFVPEAVREVAQKIASGGSHPSATGVQLARTGRRLPPARSWRITASCL